MPKYDSPALRAAFAAWGRQKGIRPASTEAGLRVQLAQFIADTRARVDNIGAAGDNVYAGDPLQVAEQKITMLRNSGGLVDITEPETEDSDFGDLIRQQHAAMEEAGGDDLAAGSILKGQNKAAATAAAPATTTNPLSALDSPLGNQVTLAIGDLKEIARWTGQTIETRDVTIIAAPKTLNIALPGDVPFSGEFRPYVLASFGSQGYLTTVEVDLCSGAQFTVTGSMVVLQIGLVAFGTNAAANTITLDVVGMLSFSTCMRTAPITRTLYFDNVVAAFGSTAQIIPAYARRFTVFRSDPANVLVISVGGTLGITNATYIVPASSNTGGEVSPMNTFNLPGNFSNIFIQRQSGGADGTQVQLVFELGI